MLLPFGLWAPVLLSLVSLRCCMLSLSSCPGTLLVMEASNQLPSRPWLLHPRFATREKSWVVKPGWRGSEERLVLAGC